MEERTRCKADFRKRRAAGLRNGGSRTGVGFFGRWKHEIQGAIQVPRSSVALSVVPRLSSKSNGF